MKKQPLIDPSCGSAAIKIQYWMDRDKRGIFPSFFYRGGFSIFWSGQHRCDLVKIPRLPPQVKHLSLYGYQLKDPSKSKRKKQTVGSVILEENSESKLSQTVLQNHCCSSRKNSTTSADLAASHSIFKWRLKEHQVASSKLKKMGMTASPDRTKYAFTSLTPTSKKEETQEPDYWEEALRAKENHLFNIKYPEQTH